MRILMLVQALDERDWLRGFIVRWVCELAAQVERLDVIALEVGQAALPDNVFVQSLGKERHVGRAAELANFHRAMRRVGGDVDVILSHMTPRYTLLAAPYAALYGKRQMIWYTHRHVSLQLRLALACCWRVVTAAQDSFPLPSAKVRVLGHGIDTEFYTPPPHPKSLSHTGGERDFVVHVARLMPIKHQATLIRAMAQVPGAQAVIVGAVPEGQDAAYAGELKILASDPKVENRVIFTGGLLSPQVRDWYRQAAAAVNLSPPGLFDKAALESMACGLPTIVSSRAFDSLLGEYAERLRLESPDDADALAARLRDLLALSPEERAQIGRTLRQRVIAAHSLKSLMPRLVQVMKTGEL